MRKFAVCISFLFLVAAFVPLVRAQAASTSSETAVRSDAAKPPAHYYRLNFVLEELDPAGKPVNSRSFDTAVSTAQLVNSSIVVGTRVPIATGTQGSKNGADNLSTQITYIDVGVKITAREVHEDGNRLSFNLDAEIASLASNVELAGFSEPVLRQNSWRGDVMVPIGKRTVVFTSDSLDSKGSTRVAVTATPLEQ